MVFPASAGVIQLLLSLVLMLLGLSRVSGGDPAAQIASAVISESFPRQRG